MSMKIIELVIDELQEDGVEAISVVESPAIEENFVALKSDKSLEIKFEKQDGDKRILMGPILIPNKPIYRVNGEDEYYIYFSRDTVKKASELYLQAGNQSKSTLEHQMALQGLTLVESWIVEDKANDKSNLYEMDVPVGTWMGAIKVNNEDIWNNYVKTGKVKGFSIEGYFADKAERPKENLPESLAAIEEAEAGAILEKLKGLFKDSEAAKLESFNDYPQAVKNNAKRGRELNEKVNNKCATQVGKVRGATLEKGGNLEVDTIMRMYSYLSRAEEDYDENDTKACGTISYLLWGGLAGKRWAESKLKELGKI